MPRKKSNPRRLDSFHADFEVNDDSKAVREYDVIILSDQDSDAESEVDASPYHARSDESLRAKKKQTTSVMHISAKASLRTESYALYLGSVELHPLMPTTSCADNLSLKLSSQTGLHVTSDCNDSSLVARYIHNEHPSLWKHLREAIDKGVLMMELLSMTRVLLYLDWRKLAPVESGAKIILSPMLLDFCLRNRKDRPEFIEFDDETVIEDFNPKVFIEDVTTNTDTVMGAISPLALTKLKNILHDAGLLTELKKYQLDGVYFMWEHFCGRHNQFSSERNDTSAPWFKLISSVTLGNGSDVSEKCRMSLWFNILSEEVFCGLTPPSLEGVDHKSTSCILSDEPGLGKTLTCLSLILLIKNVFPMPERISIATDICHSRNGKLDASIGQGGCLCDKSHHRENDGLVQCNSCGRWNHTACYSLSEKEVVSMDSFQCLACDCNLIRASGSLINTKCVMVVVPDPIVQQWTQEINKHFSDSALSVILYDGCDTKTLKRTPYHRLRPCELARADVIIVSLRTLQAEFHLANRFPCGENTVKKSISLRKGTSSSFASSTRHRDDYFCPPWLCLHFSLLLIDETQKIESLTSSVSSMASRISAGYRISVSATPLAKNSFADINPLCQFLRVEPFCHEGRAWKQAFERKRGNLALKTAEKVKWMKKVLFSMIIRRTKKSVYHELGLPPKEIIIRSLELSAFEKEMYKENRDLVVGAAERLAISTKSTASDEIPNNLASLLQSLRKLCCHPQVWNSNLQGTGGTTLPFRHIMCVKVEEMRAKAEDAQRQLLYHLFSMAGSNLLLSQISQSSGNSQQARYYRQRAFATYNYAYKVMNSNRMPVPLCGTLKMISDSTVGVDDIIACTDGNLLASYSPKEPTDISFHFTTGRRLLTLELTPTYQLHGGHTEAYFCMPKVLELYANTGLGDSMTLISSMETRTPCLAQSQTERQRAKHELPPIVMKIPEIKSMRARSWRLRVASYHDTCVYVRAVDWRVEQSRSDTVPFTAHKEMQCRIKIFDSGICVDMFQELHLLHQLIDLSTKNSECVDVKAKDIPSLDLLGEKFQWEDSSDAMTPVAPKISPSIEKSSSHRHDLFGVNDRADGSDVEFTVGQGSERRSYDLACDLEVLRTQDMYARNNAIQDAYMTQINHTRTVLRYRVQELVNKTNDEVTKLLSYNPDNRREWWLSIIDINFTGPRAHELVYAIQTTVNDSGVAYQALRNCNSLVSIGAVLEKEFKDLQAARKTAIAEILKYNPTEVDVLAASDCKEHAAYFNKKGPVCSCCRLERYLVAYDSKLYSYRATTKRIIQQTSLSRRGESDETVETKEMNEQRVPGTFAMLISHLKQFSGMLPNSQLRKSAIQEMSIIGAMQGELASLTSLWQGQLNYLKARDELQMATYRVCLIDDDAIREEESNALYACEVEPNFFEAINAAAGAESESRRSLSSLQFYKSQLPPSQLEPLVGKKGSEGGNSDMQSNEEAEDKDSLCLICREDMVLDGETACFLPCAHKYHRDCITLWLHKKQFCPFCKQRCTTKDIFEYLEEASHPCKNRKNSSSASSAISLIPRRVRGQWGTKIDNLMLDLLDICERDEGEKSIVFSSWVDMLQIVGSALTENSLKHVMCLQPKDFRGRGSKINQFKMTPNINILLMPLNLGAEGLDLIVANNIFLLEPLLNPSIEVQALNRCDRLGQTRSTRVYKYVSLGTIEEKILKYGGGLTEEDDASAGRKEERVTAAALRSLLNF